MGGPIFIFIMSKKEACPTNCWTRSFYLIYNNRYFSLGNFSAMLSPDHWLIICTVL